MNLFLRAVVALALPMLLIWFNVRLLASPVFLRWEYERIAIEDLALPDAFDQATRQALAETTTRYVIGAAPRSEVEALRSEEQPLYALEEIDHLADVRSLIGRLRFLGVLSAIVLLAAFFLPPLRRRIDLPKAMEIGGWLSLGLVGVVGLGLTIGWAWLFRTFHQLLFPPGTWTFSAESGLLLLFPDRFWFESALALAGLTLVEGLVIALAARRMRRHAPASSS